MDTMKGEPEALCRFGRGQPLDFVAVLSGYPQIVLIDEGDLSIGIGRMMQQPGLGNGAR